jgi:hypothetical protein
MAEGFDIDHLAKLARLSLTAEEKALYYEFTLNGDEVFCREAYTDADGVLTHLTNVGPQLDQMLTLSTLARLEVHGAATTIHLVDRHSVRIEHRVGESCQCPSEVRRQRAAAWGSPFGSVAGEDRPHGDQQ